MLKNYNLYNAGQNTPTIGINADTKHTEKAAVFGAIPLEPPAINELLFALVKYSVEYGVYSQALLDTDIVGARVDLLARWAFGERNKPGLLIFSAGPGTGKTTLLRSLFRVLDSPAGLAFKDYEALLTLDADKAVEKVKGPKKDKDAKISAVYAQCEAKIKAMHSELLIARNLWLTPKMALADAAEIARLADCTGGVARLLEGEESLAKLPLLMVDDLGDDREPLWVQNGTIQPLAELINARYELGLCTIFTTNLNAERLAERYSPRIVDRLFALCQWLDFSNEGNKSYRR